MTNKYQKRKHNLTKLKPNTASLTSNVNAPYHNNKDNDEKRADKLTRRKTVRTVVTRHKNSEGDSTN